MKKKKSQRQLFNEAYRLVRLGKRGVFVRTHSYGDVPMYWLAERCYHDQAVEIACWKSTGRLAYWSVKMAQHYPKLLLSNWMKRS